MAIAAFERALELAPGHPGLLINLGVQFDRAGRQDRAERCYREVLSRRPREIAALANLAQLLFTQERLGEALPVYDAIVATAPDAPAEIWNNRGVCQRRARDVGAEASFRRALALAPASPQVLANLGFLLCEQRRYDDARPLLERAHSLDSSRLQVTAQLLDLDLQFADWTDFERKRSSVVAGVAGLGEARGQTVSPFAFLSICDDPGLQLAAAKSFAWPPARASAVSAAAANAPLRIGFAATAFHNHPVPRLVVELLERIDRGRFEVFAYALGADTADQLRMRVAGAVKSLGDLASLTADEAVARIRGDRIGILFDLTGHTERARAEIFAAHPAVLQINFVGYAGTMGASYYDYVVTDETATPASEQANFSERFAYLGACYLPSDTRRVLCEPPPSRADYGLPAGAFVFAAQCAPYKILPEMFDVWMRLLREVEGSVLWLRSARALAEQNLRREAQRRGVEEARLKFAPLEPVERYLARFRLADLYLDTYPFGSHTTVNDALFAGLPVLTLAGRSMAARASSSQLRAVGLPELIVASHDEYAATALKLVRDREWLDALAGRLRKDGHSSPLFDMHSYTRRFEELLLRIARDMRP
jgi:predicted O-linked N-acetylglucosamine transferase (SPINDLY family)